jgi:hypothetical protein
VRNLAGKFGGKDKALRRAIAPSRDHFVRRDTVVRRINLHRSELRGVKWLEIDGRRTGRIKRPTQLSALQLEVPRYRFDIESKSIGSYPAYDVLQKRCTARCGSFLSSRSHRVHVLDVTHGPGGLHFPLKELPAAKAVAT